MTSGVSPGRSSLRQRRTSFSGAEEERECIARLERPSDFLRNLTTLSELQSSLSSASNHDWQQLGEPDAFALLTMVLESCGYDDSNLDMFAKDLHLVGLAGFWSGVPGSTNLRSRTILNRFTMMFVDVGMVDPLARIAPELEEGQTETNLVAISDPGQDLDDEMSYIMMRYLVAQGMLDVRGIVTTLAPAHDRARLCRGTLDLLGLQKVPVGIGTDGGDAKGDHKATGFEENAKTYMPERNCEEAMFLEPGRHLLNRIYCAARPLSLTLLIIASLKDAALFLRDNEELFVAQTKEVVIMGGIQMPACRPAPEEKTGQNDDKGVPELETVSLEPGTFFEPDDSHNQTFDKDASGFFFRRCQELGVRIIVVSRFSAYAAQMPRGTYDTLALMGSSIGRRLRNQQRDSLEQLWQRATRDADDPKRTGLPPRCDRTWFCNTFCSGDDDERPREQPIWDLVKSFNQYDTMALIASVPSLRRELFAPLVLKTTSLAGKSVENLIIGVSKDEPNLVMPSTSLVNLFRTGFEAGLCINHHFKGQIVLVAHFRADTVVDLILMAIMLRTLYQLERLHCVGIVLVTDSASPFLCEKSKQIIRDTLDHVGLRFVPVHHGTTTEDAAAGLKEMYANVLPAGLTLVVSASLTAVDAFVEKEPAMFVEKTQRVILLGGVKCREHKNKFLEPDPEAQNNRLDMPAATRFYAKAQEMSVALVVLSRFMAASQSVPYSIFPLLASHGGIIGKFAADLQSAAMQSLWRQSCLPGDSVARGSLPARCDSDWFRGTFCHGLNAATKLTPDDDISKYIKTFNAYTPLALLFAMPEMVGSFVTATPIEIRAATHLVLGWSADEICVSKPVELQRILLHGLVYGARCNVSDYSRNKLPPIPVGESGGAEVCSFDLSESSINYMLPKHLTFAL